MPTDESWAQIARDTREALRYLAYPIDAKCLPDESEPCGASFAQHAAAHLATIKAICDHQIGHLGPAFLSLTADVYMHATADLAERERE